MPVRPKDYDRPGYREQSMKRREIERIANAEISGSYETCTGCGLSFPSSVLNVSGECRDCETYDPRDHDTDEERPFHLSPNYNGNMP